MAEKFHDVGIDLDVTGIGSITIDGVPLKGTRSIVISSDFDGTTEVEITMLANVRGNVKGTVAEE